MACRKSRRRRASEALTLRPADQLGTAADAHGSVLLASGALVEVLSKSTVRFEPIVNAPDLGEELVLTRGTVDLKCRSWVRIGHFASAPRTLS